MLSSSLRSSNARSPRGRVSARGLEAATQRALISPSSSRTGESPGEAGGAPGSPASDSPSMAMSAAPLPG
eukprot:11208009-Lingulodinium_polyedra.AAC.1